MLRPRRAGTRLGWGVGEALLLAVGYGEADAVLLAHEPLVLH